MRGIREHALRILHLQRAGQQIEPVTLQECPMLLLSSQDGLDKSVLNQPAVIIF